MLRVQSKTIERFPPKKQSCYVYICLNQSWVWSANIYKSVIKKLSTTHHKNISDKSLLDRMNDDAYNGDDLKMILFVKK